MRKCLFALLLLFTCSGAIAQFTAKKRTASNGVNIDFYQFTPEDYSKNGQKHPVIIFLHGISERGGSVKDLPKVLKAGLPKFIKNGKTNMRFKYKGKWESFVVLIPQLSNRYGSWQQFYTAEMIEYATQNLNIDEDRIFLTGLSLGGGGVWSYASGSLDQAKKLAGIAPICGTCAISNAGNIAKAGLPVWAFHAKDDNRVSVSCSQNAVKNILANAPGVEPILTLWNNGKHNVWDRVYDPNSTWIQPSIYEWFLSQSKGNTPQKPQQVNKKPVAAAGKDVEIRLPTNSVTLNGSGSSDADGRITSYTWSKVSGPNTFKLKDANKASAKVEGLKAGTYVFRLAVKDNDNATDHDDVTLKVLPKSNQKPVANAGANQTITLPKSTVQLDGSQSKDPDGKIVSYKWKKMSGNSSAKIANPNNAKATVNKLVAGTYVFRLTVTDDDKATAYNDVRVVVEKKANKAPKAHIEGDDQIVLPVNKVFLSGRGSEDSDGKIEKYQWTKVSGPTRYQISAKNNVLTEVTGLVKGTYVFRLTVWDDDNAKDIADFRVIVEEKPKVNQAPTVQIEGRTEITLPQDKVEFSGRSSTDADGKIVRYLWTKVSGPSSYIITGKNNVLTEIGNLSQGTYVFRLTAWDDKGASAYRNVTVRVNAPSRSLAPKAVISGPSSISYPATSIELSGRESVTESGNVERYLWTKISGPESYSIPGKNNAKTLISRLVPGTYVFRLTVWDKSNRSAFQHHTVTVTNAASKVPAGGVQARITGPSVVTLPATTTELSGRESTSSNGVIVQYRWSKISGPRSYTLPGKNNAKTLVGSLTAGTYVFRLVVTDSKGASSQQDFTLTVRAAGPAAASIAVQGVQEKTAAPVTTQAEGLSVYPNPAISQLTVRFNDPVNGSGMITIYDAAGRSVYRQPVAKNGFGWQQQVNVSDLKAGVYTLELRLGDATR